MKTPQPRTRAEINRANAQHSTGPKTTEGKAASSENSFKHGLYTSQVVVPGEDPAALDALKADLRAEHQPANTTEELLVNEIAEHYWRIRRYRRMEAASLALPNEVLVVALMEYLPLYQRFMSASERGLHKSLTALRQLQKDRGFVPHIAQAHSTDNCKLSADLPTDNCELTTGNCRGFVPHIAETPAQSDVCEPSKAAKAPNQRFAKMLEYAAIDPNDAELQEQLAADLEILGSLKTAY